MADLPIPFSALMIRALLREIEAPGTGKTQTRQVLKPQPDVPDWDGIAPEQGWYPVEGGMWKRIPYAKGDRLWVREAARFCSQMDGIKPTGLSQHEPRLYEADGFIYEPACMMLAPGKLRQPKFMPRWASRITLLVTDVRVERLRDISEADARAEGVDQLFSAAEVEERPYLGTRPMPWLNYLWHGHHDITHKQIDAWPYQYSGYSEAKGSFSSLWERLHGPGAWALNPWVVACTFRPILGNIDKIGEVR